MKKIFMWAYALFMLFAPIVGLVMALVHFKGNMDWAQWSILSITVIMGIYGGSFVLLQIYEDAIQEEVSKQTIPKDPVQEVMEILHNMN